MADDGGRVTPPGADAPAGVTAAAPLAVCATPIGNLADVTLRVLDELRSADLVLCEDTRHTALLLRRHRIEAHALQSLHRHNEATRVAGVLRRLERGERVALVSDAGMPLVNDPGDRLVAAVLDAGLEVRILPGPSAVETALAASGLAAGGGGYRFLGWLPRRQGEREALWAELRVAGTPVVAFESPRRLSASLASLARVAPEHPVAVCRELTKRHEEIVRGRAEEIAAHFVSGARGEVTVVFGASGRDVGRDLDAAASAVAELVAAGASRRGAADVVARLTGTSRNALYRDSL